MIPRIKQNLLPSEKKFGFFFALVLGIYGSYKLVTGNPILGVLFIILAATLVIIALVIPKILRPLNIAWYSLGEVLHRIFNPVILALIFYGIITPTALINKALNRDKLKLKNVNEETYWVIRENNMDQLKSFNDQF